MGASDLRSGGRDESAGADDSVAESDVLAGELAVLREENERLRREYALARRTQYRRSAGTLFAVGALAFLAGVVFANARTVLFALGGTGAFLGVLIYFLTPERFISASVGDAVYSSLARNHSRVVSELGLSDRRVYVPVDEGDPTDDVRLFVPQRADYAVPDDGDLASAFVGSGDPRERGFAVRPTARGLYDDFAEAVAGGPSDDPADVASELADALVEQFDLVDSARVETTGQRRLAVRVGGSARGDIDRFDPPVASLVGTGVALAAAEPTAVEVTTADEEGAEHVVTCSWGDTERTASR